MKRIIALLFIMLVGCAISPLLPDKPINTAEYIPVETPKKPKVVTSADTWNTYPDDCQWATLREVMDGDTIELRNRDKVRMIGIDTPEVAGPYTDEEPGGKAASDYLKAQLRGETEVCLISDTIGDTVDKYDRLLRYVYHPDGRDLNAEMVDKGYARVYTRFPFDRKSLYKELAQDR